MHSLLRKYRIETLQFTNDLLNINQLLRFVHHLNKNKENLPKGRACKCNCPTS